MSSEEIARKRLIREKEKTSKAIRILVYTITTILLIFIFSLIISSLFFGVTTASIVSAFNKATKKQEKIVKPIQSYKDTVINKDQVRIMQEVMIRKENQNKAEGNNGKFKGTIYSWTDKNGARIHSNIGFPKDEPYSDARIDYN